MKLLKISLFLFFITFFIIYLAKFYNIHYLDPVQYIIYAPFGYIVFFLSFGNKIIPYMFNFLGVFQWMIYFYFMHENTKKQKYFFIFLLLWICFAWSIPLIAYFNKDKYYHDKTGGIAKIEYSGFDKTFRHYRSQ